MLPETKAKLWRSAVEGPQARDPEPPWLLLWLAAVIAVAGILAAVWP